MFRIRYLQTIAMVCTGLLAAVMPTHAQERAAGSALETQMTWSTLKSLVDDANATSKAVDTRLSKVKGRVDNIEICNLKGMFYAPGKGGDEEDCITPSTTVQTDYLRRYVDESVTCVQKGGKFQPKPLAGSAPAGWKPTDTTGTCVVVSPTPEDTGTSAWIRGVEVAKPLVQADFYDNTGVLEQVYKFKKPYKAGTVPIVVLNRNYTPDGRDTDNYACFITNTTFRVCGDSREWTGATTDPTDDKRGHRWIAIGVAP